MAIVNHLGPCIAVKLELVSKGLSVLGSDLSGGSEGQLRFPEAVVLPNICGGNRGEQKRSKKTL